MGQQALQALMFLAEKGSSRLGTDPEVIQALADNQLITMPDPLNKEWILTHYGKGILQEIKSAGTRMMVDLMEKYL
jgi:hypothetical protein